MSNRRFYITTAIPYVNGDRHLGFALECVQADVLARHRCLRGEEVRFLSGTDDNSLKNVEAAEAAGAPTAEFVNAEADRFAALGELLDSGRLRIEPKGLRNEVLGFIAGGLEDFSVSRSRERARLFAKPAPPT